MKESEEEGAKERKGKRWKKNMGRGGRDWNEEEEKSVYVICTSHFLSRISDVIYTIPGFSWRNSGIFRTNFCLSLTLEIYGTCGREPRVPWWSLDKGYFPINYPREMCLIRSRVPPGRKTKEGTRLIFRCLLFIIIIIFSFLLFFFFFFSVLFIGIRFMSADIYSIIYVVLKSLFSILSSTSSAFLPSIYYFFFPFPPPS